MRRSGDRNRSPACRGRRSAFFQQAASFSAARRFSTHKLFGARLRCRHARSPGTLASVALSAARSPSILRAGRPTRGGHANFARSLPPMPHPRHLLPLLAVLIAVCGGRALPVAAQSAPSLDPAAIARFRPSGSQNPPSQPHHGIGRMTFSDPSADDVAVHRRFPRRGPTPIRIGHWPPERVWRQACV